MTRPENSFLGFAGGVSDALFLIDPRGLILFANSQAAALLKTAVGELVGTSLDRLFGEADRRAVQDDRNAYLSDPLHAGQGLKREVRVRRLDGTEFSAELSVGPATPTAGGSVITVMRDVSERRKDSDLSLKLRDAVEQTADLVLLTDRQGVIEYVNPAVERVTGYSMAELLGKTPRVLKSGRHDRAFYDNLWRTILGGGVFRNTLVNKSKNGSLFQNEQTISPVRDKSGAITHFVSTGKDVRAPLAPR